MGRIAVLILLVGFCPVSAMAQGEEESQAELPPHEPGELCITPEGYCEVSRGTPGGPCGCATTDGYIEGTLG